MKSTFNTIFFLAICLINVGTVFSQQKSTYNWRLGFGAGYTNYYGDVSNYRTNQLRNLNRFVSFNKYEHNQPSLSLILNKNITPTLGLMIQASHHQFGASDRYRQRNGSFDTASMNYSRSLNFRTTLQDAGIAFSFNANNGNIFKEDAFFYPAVFVGAGVSTFSVKGDLYDEKGSRYDYRLPGNITDGIFETDLRSMRTETESPYPKIQPYINLGLALNFRISSYLTIAVQSDLKYSGSDYLDDVSKTYKTVYPTPEESYAARPGYNTVNPLTLQRGDNNNVNDFYINNRLVLNLGLSKKTQPKAFRPPVIYSLGRTNLYKNAADTLIKKRIQDSLLAVKTDSLRKVEKDSSDMGKLNVSMNELSLRDSFMQTEMQAINAQLRDIKEILYGQAIRPRYQQLQYQMDSVNALRGRILAQRVVSREDNLRVRIYNLQTDSLNNELVKLEQKSRSSSDSTDIYNRTFQQPILIERPAGGNTGNIEPQNASDSIDVRVYNDAVTVLKQDKRYASDLAYQRMVDSMQQRIDRQRLAMETNKPVPNDTKVSALKSDSIVNKAYQQRIDSLLERLDNLQKSTVYVDTSVQNKESSTSSQPLADTTAANARISDLENRLKQQADSVALINRRLQIAADSAAYYERAASSPDETVIPKKKKWYQIFGSGKRKAVDSTAYNERVNAYPDATAKPKKKKWYQIFSSRKKKAVEQEIVYTERNINQQRYYEDEVNRMRRVTDEMQRSNRQLTAEYEALNADRSRQRINSTTPEPVVIYDRNNTRSPDRDYDEILALRRELERLKYQVNESSLNGVNDRLQSGSVPVNTVAPTSADTSANSQVTQLKSALEQIRNELDSLRSIRQPVLAERPVEKAEVFDPKKFPVVSVYFKTGAVVLPQDQVAKISPFSHVAADNKAVIVLKGFTDPVGNPAINASIAGKRAAYVKSLLVSQYNIKEERIVIREPSVSTSGKTRKANALDRRVDLHFE